MWNNKQPKLLMVEDNRSNHQLFLDAFEAAGFEVNIVSGADGDFLSTVVFFEPDIISMDIMIGRPGGGEPERDGFAAIRLLKSDERTKDIPVIVMTSFFEEGKVVEAKMLGAVDFISLQAHAIHKIPDLFKRYLDNPKKYSPTHPMFRQ